MTWTSEQTQALETVRDTFGFSASLRTRASGAYNAVTGTRATAAAALATVTIWDDPETQTADATRVASGRPVVDRAVYRVLAADLVGITPTAAAHELSIGGEVWTIATVGRECRGLVWVLGCEKMA